MTFTIAPWLDPLIRCEVGSRIYGCSTGDDDTDEMVVAVPDMHHAVGLENFESTQQRTAPEGMRSGPNDVDLVIHSARKWMRLALAGNPTILVPLFVPMKHVADLDPAFQMLRTEGLPWLINARMGFRYLGYMNGQWGRLTGELAGKRNKRPELVAKHGFDTKYAYHCLRLGMQGVELMRTGRITIPFDGPHQELLLAVRNGERTMEEVDALIRLWMGNLEDAIKDSRLRSEPDRGRAAEWLIDVHRHSWGLQ